MALDVHRANRDELAARPRRRRWMQFSLRVVLVLVTVVAGLLLGWRVYVQPYRQQRPVMDLVGDLGGRYGTEAGGPAWLREVFGSQHFQDVTLVDLADCDEPEAYVEQLLTLPRLRTLVVGGDRFTDAHLRRLRHAPSLRWLVLDSTEVSDRDIDALQKALPGLVVHRSQRRAIAAVERDSQNKVERRVVETLPHLRHIVGDEHFAVATWAYYIAVPVDDDTLRPCRLLTDLETLGVNVAANQNKMSDAALAHLSGLTKLKQLHLRGTPQITDAGMRHLAGLRRLEGLHLDRAAITDAGLEQLACGATLKELSLSDTNIMDIEQLAREFPGLESLRLDGTSITDEDLVHLSELRNLQTLWLHRVPLTDRGLEHLSRIATLQHLGVESDRITDAGLQHLKGLKGLQQFGLGRAKVSAAGLRNLRELPKLEFLYLDRMPLDADRLAAVVQCQQLKELYFNNVQVTNAGLAHLRGLTALEVVAFYNTNVNDDGLAFLEELPKLQRVALMGTQVTNAAKAALRKARPKVSID